MTRPHDVSQLTTAELEIARRELRANLGLITPGSPAHVPILAHMQAIDAELAGRAASQHRGEASATTARCFPARPLCARRTGTPGRTGVRQIRRGWIVAGCGLNLRVLILSDWGCCA
jgi:hypothetical protein